MEAETIFKFVSTLMPLQKLLPTFNILTRKLFFPQLNQIRSLPKSSDQVRKPTIQPVLLIFALLPA